MGRHILWERTSSCPISSSGSQGAANSCTPGKPCRQRSPRRFWPAACPWLDSRFSALSKSARVVLITWSPSGYTPVGSNCPVYKLQRDSLSKHRGVTRNEPKIPAICYITHLGNSICVLFFWIRFEEILFFVCFCCCCCRCCIRHFFFSGAVFHRSPTRIQGIYQEGRPFSILVPGVGFRAFVHCKLLVPTIEYLNSV